MNELLTKVKQNLILEHSADDVLLVSYINAAVAIFVLQICVSVKYHQ